jgi:hypothetical protein
MLKNLLFPLRGLGGLVFIFLCGCAHKISPYYKEIIPNNFSTELSLNDKPRESLNILYLGCGNLILEKNGEAIVTDPFFSNQGVMKMVGKIKTNPKHYLNWKNILTAKLDPSTIRAALVAHTHYDHAMDLPILLHNNFFPNMDTVFGNPNLPKMLRHFINYGAIIKGMDDSEIVDPRNGSDSKYRWHKVTPQIRFLPIESNHAPHVGKKLFMSGSLKEEKFENKLDSPYSKMGAFNWTVGSTYSFLVDFIGVADTLRVFIQTSASEAPNGLPPTSELNKKSVDLAILCYASALNVKNYPGYLLNEIQPTKTILIHWEDFFRKPNYSGKVKMVRGTNPKKVSVRLEEIKSEKDFFVMPMPGTFIKVRH